MSEKFDQERLIADLKDYFEHATAGLSALEKALLTAEILRENLDNEYVIEALSNGGFIVRIKNG